MRDIDKTRDMRTGGEFSLFCMALFFICGVAAGQVLAAGAPDSVSDELREYILEYGELNQKISWKSVLTTAVTYARYPLIAAPLGLIPGGIAFLCVFITIYGCLISFAAGSFANAWGEFGIVMGLASMGLRCLITLLCFFLLAPPVSDSPDLIKFIKFPGEIWRRRVILCVILLITGILMEITLIPHILRVLIAYYLSGSLTPPRL